MVCVRSSVQIQDLLDKSYCWLADRVVRRQLFLSTRRLDKVPGGRKRWSIRSWHTSTERSWGFWTGHHHPECWAEPTWTPLSGGIGGVLLAACCIAGMPTGGDSADTAERTDLGSERTPAGLTEPEPTAGPGSQWRTTVERRDTGSRELHSRKDKIWLLRCSLH